MTGGQAAPRELVAGHLDAAVGEEPTLDLAGLHLVGVGELLTPTTREIVRQAKLVSDAIQAQGPVALNRFSPPRAAISPLGA